ncbi:hypothetical protein [uncultured Roseobacter sp.]|uniref:hypothetical protein n=1 Tax=uncultured Roseobacter sp. TaxID=114847 RepID=UPI00260D95B5|nr:hypothetical protein [uncultured Roseobacter sp.]
MFDFVLALTVTILVLSDWLIGKEGRALMRNRVETFWCFIMDNGVPALGQKAALTTLELYDRFLGKEIFGRKHLISSLILSALFTTIVYVVLVVLALRGAFMFSVNLSMVAWIGLSLLSLAGMILPNWFVDFLSLSVTHRILENMTHATTTRVLLFWVIVDALAAVVCLIVAILIFVFIGLNLAPGADPVEIAWDAILALWQGVPPSDEGLEMLALFVIQFSTAGIPTLVHFGLATVWLLLHILEPLLHKPTTLVLKRVYESDKGVLTLLSFAIAGTAKLFQLYISA